MKEDRSEIWGVSADSTLVGPGLPADVNPFKNVSFGVESPDFAVRSVCRAVRDLHPEVLRSTIIYADGIKGSELEEFRRAVTTRVNSGNALAMNESGGEMFLLTNTPTDLHDNQVALGQYSPYHAEAMSSYRQAWGPHRERHLRAAADLMRLEKGTLLVDLGIGDDLKRYEFLANHARAVKACVTFGEIPPLLGDFYRQNVEGKSDQLPLFFVPPLAQFYEHAFRKISAEIVFSAENVMSVMCAEAQQMFWQSAKAASADRLVVSQYTALSPSILPRTFESTGRELQLGILDRVEERAGDLDLGEQLVALYFGPRIMDNLMFELHAQNFLRLAAENGYPHQRLWISKVNSSLPSEEIPPSTRFCAEHRSPMRSVYAKPGDPHKDGFLLSTYELHFELSSRELRGNPNSNADLQRINGPLVSPAQLRGSTVESFRLQPWSTMEAEAIAHLSDSRIEAIRRLAGEAVTHLVFGVLGEIYKHSVVEAAMANDRGETFLRRFFP